jgi:hypothetical protein
MAAHAQKYATLDLPRPLRSAAPLLALAAIALMLDVDPRLPWIVGGVAALFFTGAAVARAVRARRELAVVRRTADRLIVYEPRTAHPSELILWRSLELTAPERRRCLGREVTALLRSLDAGRLPSASPLRRAAARRHRALLEKLVARLDDGEPVTARGMLLAQDLVRSDASPLYDDAAEQLLARTLTRVLGALEP